MGFQGVATSPLAGLGPRRLTCQAMHGLVVDPPKHLRTQTQTHAACTFIPFKSGVGADGTNAKMSVIWGSTPLLNHRTWTFVPPLATSKTTVRHVTGRKGGAKLPHRRRPRCSSWIPSVMSSGTPTRWGTRDRARRLDRRGASKIPEMDRWGPGKGLAWNP